MKKSAIIKLAGRLANQVFGAARNPLRWLTVLVSLLSVATIALAQEPMYPLKPLDRSSPRAALKTFLDFGDAAGAFLAYDYLPSPSRAEALYLRSLGNNIVQGMDLSELPPAYRRKGAVAAALALYERR
jgi:hypothetical protein